MRRATLVNPFLVLKEAGTSRWGFPRSLNAE